jgi:curli biogenesis system outer membrane secretion channel CsgG
LRATITPRAAEDMLGQRADDETRACGERHGERRQSDARQAPPAGSLRVAATALLALISEMEGVTVKKVLSTVLLGLVALGGLASAQSAAPAPSRKKRIAVMDFDYATVQTNAASIFGTNVDVGKGIADLLVDDLVRNGTYSVIERQQMSKILGEQNFENSGRVNPATAAKVGRLLGVDAIIIGAVTEFGRETKNTGIGAVGSTFHHFGFGGFGQKKTRAIVGLSARIVNVETGEIETVADAKGQSSRKSTSMPGGGGGWGGFGAGGVNFGTSNFQQTNIVSGGGFKVGDLAQTTVR